MSKCKYFEKCNYKQGLGSLNACNKNAREYNCPEWNKQVKSEIAKLTESLAEAEKKYNHTVNEWKNDAITKGNEIDKLRTELKGLREGREFELWELNKIHGWSGIAKQRYGFTVQENQLVKKISETIKASKN